MGPSEKQVIQLTKSRGVWQANSILCLHLLSIFLGFFVAQSRGGMQKEVLCLIQEMD